MPRRASAPAQLRLARIVRGAFVLWDMVDAGADVVLVQRLMGHSSVATTVGYD